MKTLCFVLASVIASIAYSQPPIELADMESAKSAAQYMSELAQVTEDTTCDLAARIWVHIQTIENPVSRQHFHDRLQPLWMRYVAEGNAAWNQAMWYYYIALGYYDSGDTPAAITVATIAKSKFEDALQIYLEVMLHNDAIEPQLEQLLAEIEEWMGQ